MAELIVAIVFAAAVCDGLGSFFLVLSWLVAWPFVQASRGFFRLADWLAFGSWQGGGR